MKRIGVMGIAFVAACLLSAVAATGAWAGNPPGPLWLILLDTCAQVQPTEIGLYPTESACLAKAEDGRWEGGWILQLVKDKLPTGESREILATNLSPSPYGSTQLFLGGNVYIECPNVTGTGNIKGGNPGTDEATITFTGCKSGKLLTGPVQDPTEKCNTLTLLTGNQAHEIVVPVKTELVYIGTKTQAENGEPPVGDLFSPASGSTFVKIAFVPETGGSCPITNLLEVTGSAIADVTEADQLWGELDFPSSAITKYFLTSNSAEHKATLKSAAGTVQDTQIGSAGVMLMNVGLSETGFGVDPK